MRSPVWRRVRMKSLGPAQTQPRLGCMHRGRVGGIKGRSLSLVCPPLPALCRSNYVPKISCLKSYEVTSRTGSVQFG